ncbi:MAG: enoyl-CoA hydratase-related protein [Candidatus Binatia bacterium]|jgi:2-(1,2-epoxy-1,2-dihydrophenyl)acetyl-CoA isomerase
MTYTSIRTEQRGGVSVVTLCRPDALNALTDEMKRELADALETAEHDDSARAIVLTGDGRGFCAGEALNPDLVKSAEPPLDRTLRDYYHPMIERMRAMEKPIVAAVNGTCAGAGVSLALAADLRVASEKASFLMAFVKIGLVPDAGSTFFLPRLVGMGKAVEMCMLGDKVDAAEAERLGLVHRTVPADRLMEETLALAGRLAQAPTRAIGLMKRAFNRSFRVTLEDQLSYEADLQATAARTADFHEGVQAFLDKRAAVFHGR